MGHKVGWITLFAGIAGGADVILIPEIPYDIDRVMDVIKHRQRAGKSFSIVAIAEGALSNEEAALPKSHRKTNKTSGAKLARALSYMLSQDVRVAIPGHFQRGGDPTPTDRLLCTRFGAKAAEMVRNEEFGCMTALRGNDVVAIPLEEVAGKLKSVPTDSEILRQASLLGISLGRTRAV